MELVALVHGDGGGPSLFRDILAGFGATVTEVRLDRGEKPARPPEAYAAVMSFGGTMHPHEEDEHPWLGAEIAYLEDALTAGVPTLGVCLGAQLLARAAGGEVAPAAEKEIGWISVELTDAAADDPVFSALPGRFRSFQWHEYAAGLPPGAVELARSDVCQQAFRLDEAWGVQFHPEVTLDQLVRWIRAYEDPPVPAEPYIAAAQRHIGEWNGIGRTLCERFFAVLSAPSPGEAIDRPDVAPRPT
jgi:GMP synthase-like glutamine amidotransferase